MRKSINDLGNKIKLIKKYFQNETIFLILLIFLTNLISFGLGRLSKIEDNYQSIQIKKIDFEAKKVRNSIEGEYVASKNGLRYYLPWCSSVQKISSKNKIWFKNKQEAESRGYKPAKNCKGI